VKPDQVDRIRGDYYEIIKRRPWFRNEENSENQDSIIQVIRNFPKFYRPENFLECRTLKPDPSLNRTLKLELRIKKIVSNDMVESRL